MRVLRTVKDIHEFLHPSALNLSVGFVPTMGYLHDGHKSLIKRASQENDIVVCSIYVNPTQFNDPTDLSNYPRDIERDTEILRSLGCNFVFIPSNEEMYSNGYEDISTISFGKLEGVMEGQFRKNHFSGVGIVLTKLFNFIRPHKAYFGQKDYQQYLIVQKLSRDFCMGVQIVLCETVREKSGLARSSRNKHLNDEQYALATLLYKTLTKTKEMILDGVTPKKAIETAKLSISKQIQLEYLIFSDKNNLIEIPKNVKDGIICIAAFVGGVRLIDNIFVG